MARFGHNYLVHCTFRTVFGASTATKLAHLHQPMAWNVQFWHSASRLGLHHSLQTGFVCTTWSTWASSCTKISKSAHKMLTIATVNSLIDHQRTTDTPCLQELGQISKVRARNLQLAITQPASRPERQKRKFTKGRTRTQTKTMCDGNGQLLYHMANQPAHVRPHIELLYVLQKKKKKKKKKKRVFWRVDCVQGLSCADLLFLLYAWAGRRTAQQRTSSLNARVDMGLTAIWKTLHFSKF